MPAPHYGTGRRKTSTARVFLKPGSGRITVESLVPGFVSPAAGAPFTLTYDVATNAFTVGGLAAGATVAVTTPSATTVTTLPATVREYGEFGAELNSLVSAEEYEIRRLLSALRETAENLELLTERAREDPPRMLFSNPPRKLAPGEIAP